MKTLTKIIALVSLTGGILVCASGHAAAASATDTPAPDAGPTPAAAAVAAPAAPPAAAETTSPPPAASADADTNNVADFAAGQGLRMNFRQAPLEQVLTYLSKAAGYIIHVRPNVSIRGTVTVLSEQPLTKDEAVDELKRSLNENGYTAIADGRTLTILPSAEARRNYIPISVVRTFEDVPKNDDMVTDIVPVRTLNPVALQKDLQPLLPSDTTITVNEAANSLIITDTQANVRRIAEIVKKLDSVSSSVNSIEVFPLKFADAKALADLVKELFPSQDNTSGRGGAAAGGAGRFGGGGGRGGRGGGGGGGGGAGGGFGGAAGGFGGLGALFGAVGGGAADTGSTPTSRIAAVADEQSNSLVVSAPEDLMPTIKELVDKLDKSVDDITQVRIFHLKHADPGEMVDLISSLFPSDTGMATSQVQIGNGRGGGARGGAAGGARGGAAGGLGGLFGAFGGGGAAASSESEYMKKMGSVTAYADRRTGSIVVTASKDLMPQIEDMINELDEIDANTAKVNVVKLDNADPADVVNAIQAIFPASTTAPRTTTTTQDPLTTRATSMENSMNSSAATTIQSSTSARTP